MNKIALRKQFLAQRNALVRAEFLEQSQALCERMKIQPFFEKATTVLSYFSFRNEPNIESLLNVNKNWGFPRCVDEKLIWHQYQKHPSQTRSLGDRLISGKFGITEPHPDLPLLDLSKIDVILVPAVACSAQGDRLGYGAGFYDRFLASLTHKVTTVGIVFDCCFVPELPRDHWDMPLDYVCTETQIVAINS